VQTRRKLLASVGALALFSLPRSARAQDWSQVIAHTEQLTNAGALVNLPSVNQAVGVIGCGDLRELAAAYRESCDNLNPFRISAIQAELRELTQNEIYKLQRSVDASNPKALAEYISIGEAILVGIIAAISAVAIFYGAAPIVAAAGTVSLVYAIAVRPELAVIKTALRTSDGKEILLAWTKERTVAPAIEYAVERAVGATKAVLQSVLKVGLLLKDIFESIFSVIESLGTLDELRRKVERLGRASMELQQKFLPLLDDTAAIRDLVCALTSASSDALEQFISETEGAGTNCRLPEIDVRTIHFKLNAQPEYPTLRELP